MILIIIINTIKGIETMKKKIILSVALSAILTSSVYAGDNLDNVVVTAKSNKAVVDTAGSYSIVTQKEIKQMNASSIEEVLEEVTGISATVNSNSISGRKNISLRGTESRHTLILLNGKRISGSDAQIGHSDFQYNWIPMDAIQKIEIIRGPMSTLYGSQAIGGVINVITKVPNKKLEGSVDIEGGNAPSYTGGEQKTATARIAGQVTDKLSVSVVAEKTNKDEILSKTDSQETQIEGKDVQNLMFDLWYQIDESQKVSLTYIKGTEDRTRWGNDNTVLTHYDKYYEIEKEHYSASYQKEFDLFSLDLELYRTTSDSQANMLDFSKAAFPISMAGNSNTIHKMRDTVLNAEVTVDSIQNNYIVFGLETRNEDYTKDYINTSKTDFSNDADYKSAYLQDEIQLGEDFILTLGGRYDKHEKFGGEFSPKAYLLYKLDQNQRLKAGYGHGFNAPTVTQNSDKYSVSASGGKKFFGNDNLKAETSDSFEIGYEYSTNKTNFASTLFHTQIDNMISTNEFTTNQFKYENIEKAEMSGLEIEFKQEDILTNLDLSLNHTYLETKNKTTNKELRAKPKHQSNLKLNYELPYEVDSTLRYRYTGTQKDSNNSDVGGYSTVGLQLKKEVYKDLTMRVGVENLMDKQLDSSHDYDIRGRFVYLGLNYKF